MQFIDFYLDTWMKFAPTGLSFSLTCEWLGIRGNQDVMAPLGDWRWSLFLVGGRRGANHLGLAHARGRGEGGANSGTEPSLGGRGEWNGTETVA